MNKRRLTVIEVVENGAADVYPVYLLGVDRERAIDEALNEMKYACCKDFSSPKYLKDGWMAWIHSIEAVEIDAKADPDDIAEELGCLYIEKVNADGKTFAITNDVLEQTFFDYFSFSSDEISEKDSWIDVFDNLVGIMNKKKWGEKRGC